MKGQRWGSKKAQRAKLRARTEGERRMKEGEGGETAFPCTLRAAPRWLACPVPPGLHYREFEMDESHSVGLLCMAPEPQITTHDAPHLPSFLAPFPLLAHFVVPWPAPLPRVSISSPLPTHHFSSFPPFCFRHDLPSLNLLYTNVFFRHHTLSLNLLMLPNKKIKGGKIVRRSREDKGLPSD